MDEISDDDDLGNIFLVRGLVDTAPDCKELGFSTYDKGHMTKGFD